MSRAAGHVDEEGRIVPDNRERTLRFRGQRVFYELHRQAAAHVRSNPSNRLLWGVIYNAIAIETGNDPETIHFACKREAVRVGVLKPTYILLGDKLHESEPTTVVEQEQFDKYIKWLVEGCQSGSLLGVRIHLEDLF